MYYVVVEAEYQSDAASVISAITWYCSWVYFLLKQPKSESPGWLDRSGTTSAAYINNMSKIEMDELDGLWAIDLIVG